MQVVPDQGDHGEDARHRADDQAAVHQPKVLLVAVLLQQHLRTRAAPLQRASNFCPAQFEAEDFSNVTSALGLGKGRGIAAASRPALRGRTAVRGAYLLGRVIQRVLDGGAVPFVDLHRLLVDSPLKRSADTSAQNQAPRPRHLDDVKHVSGGI